MTSNQKYITKMKKKNIKEVHLHLSKFSLFLVMLPPGISTDMWSVTYYLDSLIHCILSLFYTFLNNCISGPKGKRSFNVKD